MNYFYKSALIILSITYLAACGEDNNSNPTQNPGIDVSGTYDLSINNSYQEQAGTIPPRRRPTQLIIENENGIEDIRASLSRNRITRKESDLVERAGLRVADLRSSMKDITFGENINNTAVKNIENTYQLRSQETYFEVCSIPVETQNQQYNDRVRIWYCIDGSKQTNSSSLNGKLFFYTEVTITDQNDISEQVTRSVGIPYNSQQRN